ncbi:carbohydrate kinase family protein [Candidatus Kaiserbacteria bacterium]|nr:carbohydrate kinase family protein [Candidatus Kaiserbacteria bacterium]
MDFLAIGDTTVDEFIRLKEAKISCDENRDHCTITFPWGEKIPYESSVLLPAVGNAANAAVAAARLGLSAGLVSNVGNDRFGEETLAVFQREGVDVSHTRVNDGIPTNHHYVLYYDSERTILIRHEAYPYALPENMTAPKWIYLSSLGEGAHAFHDELAAWLADHPETKLAFQPGTFQIQIGRERLRNLYAQAAVFASNKQEAENILGVGDTDVRSLLEQMRALGPKIVLITNGVAGAYGFDGEKMLKVPMYPDPKPPYERTGAGDAATATFVAALALGKPLEEALRWGPINSMSVVQFLGAQEGLLSRDALEKLLADAPESYAVTTL